MANPDEIKKQELWDYCKKFIDDQNLYDDGSYEGMDWHAISYQELVEGLVKIIGYKKR